MERDLTVTCTMGNRRCNDYVKDVYLTPSDLTYSHHACFESVSIQVELQKRRNRVKQKKLKVQEQHDNRVNHTVDLIYPDLV